MRDHKELGQIFPCSCPFIFEGGYQETHEIQMVGVCPGSTAHLLRL